tara:strand:- start:3997 stop:4278 length:282 start_codon:yes stop_codon:yes gene_type:complete
MSDYFIKLAEEKRKKRSLAKDIALVAGGTGLGATAGYGASALLKHRYGKTLDKIDPNKRLKYLVPASAAVGGAASLVHVLRQNAEKRAKNERG